MQLIYVIKAKGTNHFGVHLGVIPARKFKIANWPPYWIYAN